jgi:hypothetical protein
MTMSQRREPGMAGQAAERVSHYIPDGSDQDLRRLLIISELNAAAARAAFGGVGVQPGWNAIDCGCGPLGGLARRADEIKRAPFRRLTPPRLCLVPWTTCGERTTTIAGCGRNVAGLDACSPLPLAHPTRASPPGRTPAASLVISLLIPHGQPICHALRRRIEAWSTVLG